MSPVCKMADNGRLTVDQKVKVILFYAETKSVVAIQRRFRAHFGTRWVPCKQTIYRLSLGTIFQPMRINSVQMSNAFAKIKMCYVYNQWYDISYATVYDPYILCYRGCILHVSFCILSLIRRYRLGLTCAETLFFKTEMPLRGSCHQNALLK